MTFEVHFDRVGRNVKDHTEIIQAKNKDEFMEAVHHFCLAHIISSECEVMFDWEKHTGQIEYGRFGEFQFKEIKDGKAK